jgi:hypothetical protein
VALVSSAPVESGCKRQILVSTNAALYTNPKTVLGRCIFISADRR